MPEPRISYPPELPVSGARDEIARAIRDHQVVIVAGATGSGKTTQLPKIALELGRERIAHTQPRRLAARTIAERVAEELDVPLGGLVGYKVRFTDKVSDATRIALMTDGILLNEIHRDRTLSRYDTIIVDEAHERSLNVDFLLGYLRQLLPQRPDLKVIITSATIDPQSFAKHFAAQDGTPAPIIEVSGRTFPVEIRYRPLVSDVAAEDTPAEPETVAYDAEDEVSAIVAALRELDREAPGDVLVFLPGEAEIRDAADAVRGAFRDQRAPTEVLPLYGRLSAAEQHRVFERSTVAGVKRRVVLATNVAETSLTVPGIKYVIDTGTARISRYSNRAKVQRLPIEAISQASAQQRSGRAGRTSAGIAIRLYGEDDFARRPEFTEPEILRTSLASVILQALALDFGDIQRFPFLTPPDSRGVKAATDLLIELGAVVLTRDGAPRLTRIGRDIASLPIDPRFARMLIEAHRNGTVAEVLAIVSGLSIQDVRERPEDQREQADQAHARFADPTSDFLTLLNLWNHLQEKQRELGSSAFRRLCRSEFLNYVRVREWFDVHRQLRGLASGLGGGKRAKGSERTTEAPVRAQRAWSEATPQREALPSAERSDAVSLAEGPRRGARERATASGASDKNGARGDLIHQALLAGLLSQIGVLDEREKSKDARGPRGAEYRGARGIRFSMFPGSVLRKRRPKAVMAAELVETSRLFARTAAQIDPAWAESLAGDLAKRQVSEPHWSKDAGAAVAYEKVTLYGVEIVPRRRIQFARVDRAAARELFVRHALVEGEWDPSRLPQNVTAFLRQNHELRRRLEKLEERERRRDILAGDEAVFAFYDARIPAEVFDVRSFETWWRDALSRTPKLLTMREADLVEGQATSDAREFPTRWTQGDQTLNLAYRFEPGAPDDGVTVVVPLALLASLEPVGFDWQVPGMRSELVTALLRALPKAIRRHVVPAADWAEKLSGELEGQGPEDHAGRPPQSLREALAKRIQRVANQPVTAADFELERVPGHLTMSFRAVDERGRALGADRDLRTLQDRLAGRARQSVARSLDREARRTGPAEVAGARPVLERTGLTDWDLGDLPEVVDTKVAGGVVRGYPALVDEGSTVALRVEATPERATADTRRGVRRLLLLQVPSPVSYVQEHLTANEKLALAASPYPSAKALIEDCRAAVADAVLDRSGSLPRTRAAFDALKQEVTRGSVDDVFACVSLVARILTAAREVERGLKKSNSMALLGPLGDIRGQLAGLIHPGFVSATGLARLQHLPRYLEGIRLRLEALPDNPGRDRAWTTELERATAAYAEAGGTIPLPQDAPEHLVRARWLLEELRVGLFAQRLGTAEQVSVQRLQKALRP
ncbi:ATP-dependent RNA helicase HrpA [Microbacterium paludicola]|uniref:ATP-dependent RNA helicase HrpA n=1 Tax=Microbacterium paludicola TaxID=300019 RepID=A0A4Y9G0W1_9MICO|nr:ATP-dependent RNA helicase HrpA [Microbacterium paludicola]TFU34381.1 ATP-dependent RNA helicase HrpA [Microbacterium paludicola]